MIIAKQRSDIHKLREEFSTGVITKPPTVNEQTSVWITARMLDINESREEKKAQRTSKKDWPRTFPKDKQHLRWGNLKELGGTELLPLVRDELFPFFRKLNGGTTFSEYMSDAQLMVQKPSL